MPIVEVAGYGPVEFPEGTTKAEMEKALRMLPPKPAAEKAAPTNLFADESQVYDPVSGVPMGYGLGQTAGATALAAATGALKPIAGAAQFVGINAPARKAAELSKTAEAIGGTSAKAGELVGEIASPVPLKIGQTISKAAPGVGRVLDKSPLAKAAVTGAGYSALTPVTEEFEGAGDFAGKKAEQMGMGAGLGAAFGKGAQLVLNPRTSQALTELKNMGMKYFTPGQLAGQIPVVGGALRKAESAATSFPVAGNIIEKGLSDVAGQYNKAIGDRVLAPMGERIPKSVQPGEELVNYVNQRIENAYDTITPKLTIGNITYKDPTSQSGFTSTVKVLNDKVKEVTQGLPSATGHDLESMVHKEFNKYILDPLLNKRFMTGEEFRRAEKNLGRVAQSYLRTPEFHEVGVALRELQSELRQELAAQNPALAQQLKGIHLAFRRHLPMERAASYLGAEQRVFTPSQLESAVRAETKGRGKFASGQGLLYPEAQAGVEALGRKMPTSGTAERSAIASLLGLGGYGLAGAAGAAKALAAPTLISGALYNKPVMRGLTALATERPEAMRKLERPTSGVLSRLGGVYATQPEE